MTDVCRWAELQAATGELEHSVGRSASPPLHSLACSLTCTIRSQNAAWTRSPCPRAGEHARADPSTSAHAPAEGFRQEPKPTFVRDAVMPLWHPSGPRCRNVSDSVWLRASSPSAIRDVSMRMAMRLAARPHRAVLPACTAAAPQVAAVAFSDARMAAARLRAAVEPSSSASGPRARPSPMHPDGRPHFAPLLRSAHLPSPSDQHPSSAARRHDAVVRRHGARSLGPALRPALGPPPPCPLRSAAPGRAGHLGAAPAARRYPCASAAKFGAALHYTKHLMHLTLASELCSYLTSCDSLIPLRCAARRRAAVRGALALGCALARDRDRWRSRAPEEQARHRHRRVASLPRQPTLLGSVYQLAQLDPAGILVATHLQPVADPHAARRVPRMPHSGRRPSRAARTWAFA